MELEKKDEQENSQPNEGSTELEKEVAQPKGEVAIPAEEVAQLEEATLETEEEEQQTKEGTIEVDDQGIPTTTKQTKKGKTMPNIPRRTNPSRKAKESVTPAIHQVKEATSQTSSKAKRKMDFSQEAEKPVDKLDQVVESLDQSPRTDPDSIVVERLEEEKKPQSDQIDEEAEMEETTEAVDAEGNAKEHKDNSPYAENQSEMTKELEEERAEMARARKGKGKAPPKTMSKTMERNTGGPVIQEPSGEKYHVLIESSDDSDEEFVQAISYDKYSDEINEETMDAIR